MSVVVVVPARFASTRYPGKPLVSLAGAGGAKKSLVQRSWEAAMASEVADRVVVATEDESIAEHARGFGAEVVMTSDACRNGSERCAEALTALGEVELVVNLQGDAPLTPPWFIDEMVAALRADDGAQVATPVLRCDAGALAAFRADRAEGRVGGTTAVFDRAGRALYFSKEVLPYADALAGQGEAGAAKVFHHVGAYTYRPEALRAYADWPEGRLEKIEGLEQLRFMENGMAVSCVEVEARGRVFWELNNPVDVARVEAGLAAAGIA